MYYMMAFNNKNNIITYWDEPTITLDYEDHTCHEIIKKNWNENIIPNIILCSATLPSQDEITDTINNYKEKFKGEIYSIKSTNYNKSISLINKEGNLTSLHTLYDNYREIYKAGCYCINNKNLLRYLDLGECINLISIINDNFINEIKIVVGDEWNAGNLSYHLDSRPSWILDLKDKASTLDINGGVIYAGNPQILKEICPGVFGTIKPVGYCMIGQK